MADYTDWAAIKRREEIEKQERAEMEAERKNLVRAGFSAEQVAALEAFLKLKMKGVRRY